MLSDCEVVWVDAKDFISDKRLDICIQFNYIDKYLTIKNSVKDANMRDHIVERKMIKTVEYRDYKARVDAFTRGTYCEQDGTKSSFKEYVTAFNRLIDSMGEDGVVYSEKTIVPIGIDGLPSNGSHRISCAIYYGLKIPTITLGNKGIVMDTKFLNSRFVDISTINRAIGRYNILTNSQMKCLDEGDLGQKIKRRLMKFIDRRIFVAELYLIQHFPKIHKIYRKLRYRYE